MGSGARLLLGISVVWVPLAFLFDGVTVLVLPLRLGGDASQLGFVSLVGLGIAAGLQPAAGWMSDRLRDRIDRRAFLALAAVPAVAGLWLLVGTGGALAGVLGYVALQVGATGLQAAQQTLIPEHVDRAARGRAAGLKAAFDVGGAFVAFVVLGAVLASDGLIPAGFVITAVIGGALIVVIALVPGGRPDRRGSRGRERARSLPPGLVPLIASRFLFLLGTYAVGRFLVLLVADRLGIPPDRAVADAGWLLALLTLATAVAAVPAGWVADRRSRRELMRGGALIAAIGIAVLAAPGGVVGVVAGGLLMSLGTAAFVVANWAATTALVPPREAGALMAVANLGTGLAAAAAGLAGPLMEAYGFAPTLLVAATATAAASVPLVQSRLQHQITWENAR